MGKDNTSPLPKWSGGPQRADVSVGPPRIANTMPTIPPAVAPEPPPPADSTEDVVYVIATRPINVPSVGGEPSQRNVAELWKYVDTKRPRGRYTDEEREELFRRHVDGLPKVGGTPPVSFDRGVAVPIQRADWERIQTHSHVARRVKAGELRVAAEEPDPVQGTRLMTEATAREWIAISDDFDELLEWRKLDARPHVRTAIDARLSALAVQARREGLKNKLAEMRAKREAHRRPSARARIQGAPTSSATSLTRAQETWEPPEAREEKP